jgi:hypothetical protein
VKFKPLSVKNIGKNFVALNMNKKIFKVLKKYFTMLSNTEQKFFFDYNTIVYEDSFGVKIYRFSVG